MNLVNMNMKPDNKTPTSIFFQCFLIKFIPTTPFIIGTDLVANAKRKGLEGPVLLNVI